MIKMVDETDKSKEIKIIIFVVFLSISLAVILSFINIMDREFYSIYLLHYYNYQFTSIFRVIPNLLILGMTNLLYIDGNVALLIFNSVFLSITSIVFYKYLRLFFSVEYSIVGIFIFFTCIPVLYYVFFIAFYDSLIYLIVVLGFYALQTKNEKLFIITTIIGAFVKETILILPFCYLFTYNDREIKYRLPITIMLAGIYIAERLVLSLIFPSPGSFLLDSLAFIFTILLVNCMVVGLAPLAFNGYFFVIAIIQYFNKEKKEHEEFLSKNLLPALLFIFLTTFVLGRFNELRLIFIGFPIIIPLAMYFMQKDLKIFQS